MTADDGGLPIEGAFLFYLFLFFWCEYRYFDKEIRRFLN